jgi:hypothetical protein
MHVVAEHYGAPLYLDCCGLVRRAARDLADEFGFLIGKWNQAYQVCFIACSTMAQLILACLIV